MFSDECTVQNDPNKPGCWTFRYPSEKWDPVHVNLTVHGKPTISIMVWGAIWREGRSKLVFLERDMDSPRKGYSSRSYIQALEEGLLPEYDGTRHFQQDNAKIHLSKASMAWLLGHGIALWDWPAHSPDLNPIEHV